MIEGPDPDGCTKPVMIFLLPGLIFASSICRISNGSESYIIYSLVFCVVFWLCVIGGAIYGLLCLFGG